MNPFDYSNNITQSTENIWQGELSEKEYNPFMVNRALSQFMDTVLFANEMNMRGHIPPKQQYDFLRLAIQPKKKRFAKWHKPDVETETKLIADHFGLNYQVAEQYLSLLNNSDKENILSKLEKGGRNAK